MAMISEIKCARCDRKYSGIRSRCPYCGELRIGRGKNAEDAENSRGKMLICVLILAVLTVGAAVLLITTPEPDEPPPNGAIEQNGEEEEDENGPGLGDEGIESLPGPDQTEDPGEQDPSQEEDPDPPEPAPPTINSIIVTQAGVPLHYHDEYTIGVNERLTLGVRIDPAAAADYAEIRWESSHPNIAEVVAQEAGLTAVVTHLARGVTRITVFVDDLSFVVNVQVV